MYREGEVVVNAKDIPKLVPRAVFVGTDGDEKNSVYCDNINSSSSSSSSSSPPTPTPTPTPTPEPEPEPVSEPVSEPLEFNTSGKLEKLYKYTIDDLKKPEIFNEINTQLIEWFVTTGINPDIKKDIDIYNKNIGNETIVRSALLTHYDTLDYAEFVKDTVKIQKIEDNIKLMTPTKKSFCVYSYSGKTAHNIFTMIPGICYHNLLDTFKSEKNIDKFIVPKSSRFMPVFVVNGEPSYMIILPKDVKFVLLTISTILPDVNINKQIITEKDEDKNEVDNLKVENTFELTIPTLGGKKRRTKKNKKRSKRRTNKKRKRSKRRNKRKTKKRY